MHELCVQGWYAAFGMFGIAAANNGKAKEAADLAAELVHMGWGVLVSRTSARLSHICSRQYVVTASLLPRTQLQTCLPGSACNVQNYGDGCSYRNYIMLSDGSMVCPPTAQIVPTLYCRTS